MARSCTLKGNPLSLEGPELKVGDAAPDATLCKSLVDTIKISDGQGKTRIFSVVPSLDTPICSQQTKRFNEEAAKLKGSAVLCVSRDLPFAHKRFCSAENIENVQGVSDFRGPSFGADYGVTIKDGPIADLFSRAIVVIDGRGKVTYTNQVAEIADEPDYAAALAAVS